MRDFQVDRDRMVDRQIASRGITDPRLLAALRMVPREQFVSADMADYAYSDHALAIEAGQTISQPYIVALMIAEARIDANARVLEVGAGSGYAAAVMSRIADHVFTIERVPLLADLAAMRMAELGYDNVTVHAGDGTLGWPEEAPFDAILVAASGRIIPEPLKQQLAIGGRLVIPLGGHDDIQTLVRVTRTGADSFAIAELCAVRFVPLIGA
ncbi:protein-L-isoaspartate(D-aspartate) O-methyltransferase [Sphingomonas cavernae]|uniref:Protein-L-isoaspartate O-methyltransferase n=1 Tax=Sphingomonas cavernae TaxID=2320861 RepID=A0A418W6G4_9SPHN|nr:protein-L-isoaspartate(D-aspartate) O-methyltransferase [Sphingomonas cavernae]RJF85625.1 protein-L-isoaspartate(D-aspartate) O-methyltransferase [Sphingomonas cavernae]